MLFLSLIGSGIGYLWIGYASALWMVFAGRIIAGITGGNISAAQAYIADVTTVQNRARGMGLFGAMFGLGFIFGPAIGGVLSRYGIHVPFLFAAILTFVNAIALYFFLPETVTKPTEKPIVKTNRFAQLLHTFFDKRFSVIVGLYFLVVMAFSIMAASFALFTMFRFGYTAEQNGYIFAYIGTLAIIFQGLLFSRLTERFGERPMVAVGCFFLVLSLFAVPFVGPNFGGLAGLLVGVGFFSLGNSLSSPALTSLASKIAEGREQGKVLGTMQSAASLARAVGPALGAVLLNNSVGKMDDTTIQRTFWTASAIMFISFLVAVYLAKSSRKVA